MKIWHFSDSHTFHKQLTIPEGIDIAIFSGDCSNPREASINEKEVRDFITWFSNLPIKYKVFIAGNHDTSIERGYITKDNFEPAIKYLENESTEIEGIKIWGSPYTPSFGMGWAFNKDRGKIHQIWDTIPKDTDIIITHGPPKGVLDLSFDRNGNLEMCGCKSLANTILEIQPKLVLFGHIHNMDGISNAGTLTLASHNNKQTIYSNGSVVWDGKFSKGITSNGNIFEL